MKQWLKKNITYCCGLFFVWVVPIILLVIMALSGSSNGIKLKTWAIIVMVVALFIYHAKLKSTISKTKERYLIKQDYVPMWIYFINWVSFIIPFVIFYLVVDNIKASVNSTINEFQVFTILCAISVSIGYIVLIEDSKSKKALATNKEKE